MPALIRTLLCLTLVGLFAPASSRAGEIIRNESYAGEPTVVGYAMWGGAGEVHMARQICEGFVEAHPQIAVELNVYPWGQYWAKLQTQAAAGLAPDIISMYSTNIGVWIEHGALLPLDDLVAASGTDLDDYFGSAVDNFVWHDRLYAFPLELAYASLVYSVDRLEESGIGPEDWPRSDEPLSWEAFKALARRLTLWNADGTIAQYGMAGGWIDVMCRMYGGQIVDRHVDPTRPTTDDERLARDIIEVFQATYAERIHASDEAVSAAGYSGGSLLLSPKFSMGFFGPWDVRTLQEAGVRYGVSPTPRGEVPSRLISVNGVGIYSGAKHPEEAWEFIRYNASAEVQPIFGKALRGVPALKSVAASALENNVYGADDVEAYLVDLDTAVPVYSSSSTYVPSAISKWISSSRHILDNEYDRRHYELTGDGVLSPEERQQLIEGMKAFVDQSVRERLPLLQQGLEDAFERSLEPEISSWTRAVLPVVILVGLLACFGVYIVAVRRSQDDEAPKSKLNSWPAYACISPWLVGLVCFTLGPILASIYLSFTEWNMIKAPVWVGALHFTQLFSDPHFVLGLKKTLSYAVLVIPISLCGGLFTAGLLTADIRGSDAFKAIFYFPSLFTGAAAAILWVNMFNKEFGVVNRLLSFLGVAPINWLDEQHAFMTVILMNLFWIGGAMIIYYAGMKQIPRSLYEAAQIDGAGPVRRFFYVTIPMLSPVILFMVIMTTIGSFQVFTPALFFAGDSTQIGQPGDSLRFYSVNIYDEAFNNLHMGKACSWAVVLFIIIFAVTMLQVRLSKRFVYTDD